MDFATCVKEDDNFKRYKSILVTVKSSLDLVKTLKEANYLHSQRIVRKLFELKVSPQKLQEALFIEISTRSRLIELKSLVINQVELLEGAISICRKHLSTTYSDKLARVASTQAGRAAVMDQVFARGKDYLSQVKTLDSQLDLIIKDIDAAGYALTNVREVMKMVLDKRETV